MDNLDEEVITVVRRLASTIKKHGVKKVVAALDELNTPEAFIEAHNSLIKFIIKETSSSFQVQSENMKRRNIRGAVFDARSMCFVLIKKHIDLKHEDVAAIFSRKNHSLVSNALKYFNGLDYEVKADRKFLEIFQKVDAKVEEKRKILWLKHS